MKSVLFIGHHKVGSSSLQDYLARNTISLVRAGILYPMVEFEGLSILLARTIRAEQGPMKLPFNLREAHNALAFKLLSEARGTPVPAYHKMLPASRQMMHAIRLQIRELKPTTIIFASEVFANFGKVAPALITRIRELLTGSDITLLATVRRIDDYLISWHGQRLRFNHKLRPLGEDGLDYYWNSIHFNYRMMLKPWLDALPSARIIIRNYSDVLSSGGSVADFKANSGIQFPGELEAERTFNKGFHRALFEILRRGNHTLPPVEAGELRRQILQIQSSLDLPNAGDVELIGQTNRNRLADRFAPIHEFLGQVARKSLFFPDIDEVRQTARISEAEANRIALGELRRHVNEFASKTVRKFIMDLKLSGG